MAEKIRLLIVDDDVPFIDSLSDILKEKGYEVVDVKSGKEALKKVEETPFDIALLDIKMPVMDGVEAFKGIKKINPRIPVIMMTAFSAEDLVKDALKEGAYGVLHKPLDIDKVIAMIEAAKKDGCLVMVVDDDPNTRETLKDILENKGFVVTLAKNGQEAIKIAKERPEDVAFIDMKLPVLNGLETYLELKKINPKITAILITAYREEMQDLIESALRQGAYACLYKPFDPQKILQLIEEITQKRRAQAQKPKTILIVDDEENARLGLSDILEKLGYKTLQALNGQEALEKARQEKPDLVLIDTRMPGTDGIELCRKLKQEEKLPLKVIVYTGKIDAIDAVKARRCGADDYCIKGTAPRLLIETVEKLL